MKQGNDYGCLNTTDNFRTISERCLTPSSSRTKSWSLEHHYMYQPELDILPIYKVRQNIRYFPGSKLFVLMVTIKFNDGSFEASFKSPVT